MTSSRIALGTCFLRIFMLLVLATRVDSLHSSLSCSFVSLLQQSARWHDVSTPASRSLLLHERKSLDECETGNVPQMTRRYLVNVLTGVFFVSQSVVVPKALAEADSTTTSTTTTEQAADIIRKPYAPLENLLPATRVKVLIDEAVDITTDLVRLGNDHTHDEDKKNKQQLIAQLKNLLLEPNEFFKTRDEVSTSKTYLDKKTWGSWKRARQEEARKKFQLQVDPVTELNESFEQWGERRQFKRLRRQQLALEQSNEMRAAFNAYTNNLVFGETYTLTASRDEKKRLIRQYDQLPDVTSVIRSDLDLRDLYRNQVLTDMDDAKAELEYQLTKDESSMDFSELLAVLRAGQSSCTEWFKFVPAGDLNQALDIVRREQAS